MSGALAENGLDVNAYQCVDVAGRNRKNCAASNIPVASGCHPARASINAQSILWFIEQLFVIAESLGNGSQELRSPGCIQIWDEGDELPPPFHRETTYLGYRCGIRGWRACTSRLLIPRSWALQFY